MDQRGGSGLKYNRSVFFALAVGLTTLAFFFTSSLTDIVKDLSSSCDLKPHVPILRLVEQTAGAAVFKTVEDEFCKKADLVLPAQQEVFRTWKDNQNHEGIRARFKTLALPKSPVMALPEEKFTMVADMIYTTSIFAPVETLIWLKIMTEALQNRQAGTAPPLVSNITFNVSWPFF